MTQDKYLKRSIFVLEANSNNLKCIRNSNGIGYEISQKVLSYTITIDSVHIRSEQKKMGHIQKLAINKESTIFVQS